MKRVVGDTLFMAGFIAIAILLALGIGYAKSHHTKAQSQVKAHSVPYDSLSAGDKNIVTLDLLTGIQRRQAGLAVLSYSQELQQSAQAKCNDMVKNDYWSHSSPTNKSYSDFITESVGTNWKFVGENLAYGEDTAHQVVKDWMASPEHKSNILDPSFTEQGFAVCHSDNFINLGPAFITVEHLAEL